MDFIEAVWRDGGQLDPTFAMKIVSQYVRDDEESKAADALLDVIKAFGPLAEVVARCISLLDTADRTKDADALVARVKGELVGEHQFIESWARHALRDPNPDGATEIAGSPAIDILREIAPILAASIFFIAGMIEESGSAADRALQIGRRGAPSSDMVELGEIFNALGRFEEFEQVVRGSDNWPPDMIERILEDARTKRRRRRR